MVFQASEGVILSFSLRRLAELASRDRRFVKRLPVRYGRHRVVCSPDNNLRILLPGDMGWDLRLFRYVDELIKPGDAVWDIGANMGTFTFAAATKARSVVSVEPDPFNVGLLRQTMAMAENAALPVTIIGAAANADGARTVLRLAERGRSTNSIVGAFESSQTGGFRGQVEVEGISLDQLLARHEPPDLIKIDTEGAEQFVLEGAEQVLRKHRPAIIVESGAETVGWVAPFLANLGYHLVDAEDLRSAVTEATFEIYASSTG
jgi:FkbM family methyltransferase